MGVYVVSMQHHSTGNVLVCKEGKVLSGPWHVRDIGFTDTTAGTSFSRNKAISSANNVATVVSDSTLECASTVGGDAFMWNVSSGGYMLNTESISTIATLNHGSITRWLYNDSRRLMIIRYDRNEYLAAGIWIETGNGTGLFYDSLDRLNANVLDSLIDDHIHVIKYAYVNPSKNFVFGTTNYEYTSSNTAGVSSWSLTGTNVPYVKGFNSSFSDAYVKWTDGDIRIAGTTYTAATIGLSDIISATISSTVSTEVVAVSSTGDVAITSNNGSNWTTTLNAISGSLEYSLICNGNGRYVAIGTGGTYLDGSAISTDGITWTTTTFATTPINEVFFTNASITFGNGIFVIAGRKVVGGGAIFTSVDGITWTERYIGQFTSSNYAEFSFTKVVFGNGFFLLASDNIRLLYKSFDGINWQPLNFDTRYVDVNQRVQNIAYIHQYGYFVGHSDAVISFSYDGVEWHHFQMSNVYSSPVLGSLFTNSIIDIHQFDGILTLISPGPTLATCYVISTTPGIGWTRRKIPMSTYNVGMTTDVLIRQYAFLEGTNTFTPGGG